MESPSAWSCAPAIARYRTARTVPWMPWRCCFARIRRFARCATRSVAISSAPSKALRSGSPCKLANLRRGTRQLVVLGRGVAVEVRVVLVLALRPNVVEHRAEHPNGKAIEQFQLALRHLAIGGARTQHHEHVLRGRRKNERIHACAQRRTVDDDDVIAAAKRRDE